MTYTRSSNTMGEECPLPGSAIFQRIFFFSLHSTGGSACGATPFASGPRHCGQNRSESAQSVVPASTDERIEAKQNRQKTMRFLDNESFIAMPVPARDPRAAGVWSHRTRRC